MYIKMAKRLSLNIKSQLEVNPFRRVLAFSDIPVLQLFWRKLKSMELETQLMLLRVIENLKKFSMKEEVSKVEIMYEETERLKPELYKMKNLLQGAVVGMQEVMQDKKVLGWLDDVEEIVEEVDDLMDDTMFYYIKFHSSRPSSESAGLIAWLGEMSHGCEGFLKRVNIGKSMENLTARVQLVNGHLQASNNNYHIDGVTKAPEEILDAAAIEKMVDYSLLSAAIEEVSFVGMEDQMAKLECLLLDSEASLKVISVYGIGGIGKTALVHHLVQQNSIRNHFELLALVTVGNSFRTRDVWKDLEQQLLWEGGEEVMSLPDLDMAQKIYELLQPKKYLIVLDDVLSIDAWECLSLAFPTTGEIGSRVLFTTRNREVAEKIAAREGLGYLHQMRGLTREEGLELLLKIAVSKGPKLDPDVLEVASNIVSSCQGLPLAIRAVGGILATNPSPDELEWRMVMRDIDSCQHLGQSSQDKAKLNAILSFAYAALPYYLKPCFLSLGLFPEGADIEAERLYLLWLAEGFIPSNGGVSKMSMMDVAEWFLHELWIRNMVLVQKEEVPTVRRFKLCGLHDLMRELCLSKCKEENFCDVIYFRQANHKDLCSFSPFSSGKIHRLALYFEDGCVVPFHWNTDKYHLSPSFLNTFGYELGLLAPNKLPDDLRDLSRVRVLYLYGFKFEALKLPSKKGKLFPGQFLRLRGLPLILSNLSHLKRLRVLVLSGFNFDITNLATGIEKLFRLRYLSLRGCNITRLPSSIFSLLNLVTLDLGECHGSRVIIPNELQKLQRLKILYLPRCCEVHEVDKLELYALRQLETLVNFDSRTCRVKDLFQLTQLQKLVATMWNFQDLEELIYCMNMSLKYLSFSSIVVRNFGCKLKEKLPLTCELFGCLKIQSLHVEGRIETLPMTISESLTEIRFSGSELKEDPIKNLEKLPGLSELVLHNNAFLGKSMTCSALGMPQLKRLTISDLPNLENFTVRKGGMAKLNVLAIKRCLSLIELPEGLSSLTSLQQLTVTGMPPAFIDRLHKAKVDFQKVMHAPVI